MKKILNKIRIASLGLMMIFFSCSKKETITPPPPRLVATVEFSANGQLFKWVGAATNIYSSDIINKDNGTIILWGSNPGQELFDDFGITMKATSLSIGTYTLTIDTTTSWINAPHTFFVDDIQHRPVHSAATEIGDYGSVTITRIHDGNYVDGTFSAKLTVEDSTTVKVNITDGKFQNLTFY